MSLPRARIRTFSSVDYVGLSQKSRRTETKREPVMSHPTTPLLSAEGTEACYRTRQVKRKSLYGAQYALSQAPERHCSTAQMNRKMQDPVKVDTSFPSPSWPWILHVNTCSAHGGYREPITVRLLLLVRLTRHRCPSRAASLRGDSSAKMVFDPGGIQLLTGGPTSSCPRARVVIARATLTHGSVLGSDTGTHTVSRRQHPSNTR